MNKEPYIITQITDNSYSDIQSLYLLSFGYKSSIDDIKNKYNTSEFGLKNIGFLAKSQNNEPAAYYGVFPLRLNYNSKDYLIAQSGDTMTTPNHRKKGLFIQLAKETYQLCQEKRMSMVFGFPNKNSYPGFKYKLDWVFTGFMQKFTLQINTIPLCELSSKFQMLKPIYNKYVKMRISKYLIDFDQINLDAFNFSNTNGQIKKDISFFKYKTKRDSVFLINIDGFILLVKSSTHLYVGEIGKIEKDQIESLISSTRKLARKLACKKVIFNFSKNHWMYNILKEKIEPSEGLPIGFYLMDKSIDPEKIQFSSADYDTF